MSQHDQKEARVEKVPQAGNGSEEDEKRQIQDEEDDGDDLKTASVVG